MPTRPAEEDSALGTPRTKKARLSVEPEVSKGTVSRKSAEPSAEVDEEDEEEEGDVVGEENGDDGKKSDLYLDTVNRLALDFDFEKVCSVSLSNINVYGCLVCGKYFQGRGKASYAYAHSIHDDHHVYVNLETHKVYVLPDGYEVNDPSLDDITAVLHPRFTPGQVKAMRGEGYMHKPSYDLSKKPYLPGFVGLNNIKRNDYLNVVIHALVHVPPLRDYLLLFSPITPSNKAKVKTSSELLNRFAALAKKLWNPRLFKSQVSPHEFLQEVGRASGGRFKITEQGDPVEFLGWVLNRLHVDMGGSKRRDSSAIYRTFQGELKMETQQVVRREDWEGTRRTEFRIDQDSKQQHSPFLFLAVDLPPPPLFQDAVETHIIPQVTLASVLAKYDGKTVQEVGNQLKKYQCQRLPPYIILHFKRFTKNAFVEEKNPTIVNFPLKGVDFSPYLDSSGGEPALYDLISNVVHESTAGTARDKANTAWRVQLKAGRVGEEEERWFELQDLVVNPVQKEMIFLGETVLQIWQRRLGYGDVEMKS